tara:strand:+ start:748 stop:885 length:138 start_codon:yes stop_codon:yes gene_type:complete
VVGIEQALDTLEVAEQPLVKVLALIKECVLHRAVPQEDQQGDNNG